MHKIMEKYYTPNIEDLRVGYESEIMIPTMYPAENRTTENWYPHIFGDKVKKDNGEYITVLQLFSDKLQKIRTPYLTKEQIEKEGWVKSLIEINKKEIGCSFLKSVWIIELINEINPFHIIIKNSLNNKIRYEGYCFSINEFRTIMKLLNI